MQKLNCKIGDLAIVVRADVAANLGQIVEIVGLPGRNSPDLSKYGHAWQVRTLGGRPTLHYRYEREGGRIAKAAKGPVPDRCLRPLPGLADEEREVSRCGEELDA